MAEDYAVPGIVGMVGQAEELFQRLTQLPEVRQHLESNKKQIGGFATIARGDGAPLVTLWLGHVFHERANGHAVSREKAHRLAGHVPIDKHRLSRQSADKALGQYSGAVHGRQYITSLAGLSSDLDEVYAAALLCRLKDADIEDIEVLLEVFGNRWVKRLDFKSLAKA